MSLLESPRAPAFKLTLYIAAGGAALAALAGMLGPHDASVWRMPSVLEAEVEDALVDAGFYHLDVEMRGQSAVLTGLVDSPEAVALAQRTALTAAGSGGLWGGGVTDVDVSGVRALTAPAPAAPTG